MVLVLPAGCGTPTAVLQRAAMVAERILTLLATLATEWEVVSQPMLYNLDSGELVVFSRRECRRRGRSSLEHCMIDRSSVDQSGFN